LDIKGFMERKMGQEIDASPLGDEWAGYIVKITGYEMDLQHLSIGSITNNNQR
jgi:ribosomal protein S6E (S10)